MRLRGGRFALRLALTWVAAVAPIGIQAQASVPEAPWWEKLGDETLMSLLREAVDRNHNLAAAVERIAQAEGQMVRSRAPIMPTLSLDAQAATGPLDGLGFQFGGIPRGDGQGALPDFFYTGSATLTARYRLSAWGSEYLALQASRLQTLASRGDRDGVAVALVTQVAESYFDAVSAAQQIAVVEEQIDISQQLADLTQLRFERGAATALDVLQQRQQLATTKANLPLVRAQLRVGLERLHALLGRAPEAERPVVPNELQAPPRLSPSEGVGSLLQNRPDLRGADARFGASRKQASSSKWSYMPNIDLSANTGSQFFRSLSTITQSTWGASISVSVPLFDGLDRVGRIRESTAGVRNARETLEQLTSQAISEVRSAQAEQEEQLTQLGAFREQLEASTLAFQESRRRYLAGLATFLDVLNALNGMQQAELSVIRTSRGVLGAWVRHEQALGGPWTRDLRSRFRGAQ